MYTLRQDYFSINRLKALPHLNIRPEIFMREWWACRDNPRRPTDTLFHYLDLHIQHWVSMLRDPSYPKDVSYCSLVSKLEVPDPMDGVMLWARHNAEDLYTLVVMAYLEVLRGVEINRSQDARQQCYAIGRLMIYRLAHMIRSWYRLYSHGSMTMGLHEPQAPEPNRDLIDLLIDIKHESAYKHYLITLFLSDYDRHDFEAVTHTTSSYVYLWRLINDTNEEGNSGQPEDR